MFFEPSTIASLVTPLCRALEEYGCDAVELLRRAGVDPDKLDVPGRRVPARLMRRVWELAVAETGDPCIGLRVAEQVRPAHLHVLGVAWMASTSVADGLRRLARYQHVLSTLLDVQVVMEKDECVLWLESPPANIAPPAAGEQPDGRNAPWPAAPVDAFLATTLSMCRILAGQDFAPLRIELHRSDLGAGAVYRKSFRAPVEFSAPSNAARFRRADVEAPIATSDPELEMQVDAIAERCLRSVESTPTVAQVRSILVELLPAGAGSQKDVAQRMGTSISTLQRQLRTEGSSFRAVLDETRRVLALHYIEDGRFTLSEVAYLLGFADQASLSRAFKRWTGSSPRGYHALSA